MAKKMRILTPPAITRQPGVCNVFVRIGARFGTGNPPTPFLGGFLWDVYAAMDLLSQLFHAVAHNDELVPPPDYPDLPPAGPIYSIEDGLGGAYAPSWVYGGMAADGLPAGLGVGPGWGAIDTASGALGAGSAPRLRFSATAYYDGSRLPGSDSSGNIAIRNLYFAVYAGDLAPGGGPDLFPFRETLLHYLVSGDMAISPTGHGYIGIEDGYGAVVVASRQEVIFGDVFASALSAFATTSSVSYHTFTLTAAAFNPHWTIYDAISGGNTLFRAPISPGASTVLPAGQGIIIGAGMPVPVEINFI